MYLRRRLESLPAAIENLCDLLHTLAPEGATGYRLLLQQGSALWAYPPSGGRDWIAHSGRASKRGYFRLWPFEVPVIPRRALYGVQFVSRRFVYRTPPPLLSGVTVAPIRDMQIEEGEEL